MLFSGFSVSLQNVAALIPILKTVKILVHQAVTLFPSAKNITPIPIMSYHKKYHHPFK
jgi:hypothetical protein